MMNIYFTYFNGILFIKTVLVIGLLKQTFSRIYGKTYFDIVT